MLKTKCDPTMDGTKDLQIQLELDNFFKKLFHNRKKYYPKKNIFLNFISHN